MRPVADRAESARPGRSPAFPRFALDEDAVGVAREVLERRKVAIFVVAFQAERFIASVLDRIPAQLRDLFAQILVIDDSSSDLTFETARAAEGGRLRQDLSERIRAVETELADIEGAALAMPGEYLAKLRKRMAELLEGIPLDETRLAQEAAYLAGRSDVTEEIVRLRAHLRQALEHLDARDGPVGKSLDFLVQEMHREVNTIGSKAEDLRISQAVLRVKAEVEKVREQVQNIE